jgi:hypothetical protein
VVKLALESAAAAVEPVEAAATFAADADAARAELEALVSSGRDSDAPVNEEFAFPDGANGDLLESLMAKLD